MDMSKRSNKDRANLRTAIQSWTVTILNLLASTPGVFLDL